MTCRDVQPLLTLFVDGELDARQMRSVALHSARCAACEGDLRLLEQCQEALIEHVSTALDAVDFSQIWSNVAPRLPERSATFTMRFRRWWDEVDLGFMVRVPAFAAVAAAMVLAVGSWQGEQDGGVVFVPGTRPIVDYAHADNSAVVNSIKGEASVAMLREPETNTLVLWVSDDGADPGFRTLGGPR